MQTYLAILGPANDALSTFVTKANAWTLKTTNNQATTDAEPLIAAVQQARARLLRVRWPAATQIDMQALVGAFGVLASDLAALQTLDMRTATSWDNRFAGDAATAGAAAASVRADLVQPSGSG